MVRLELKMLELQYLCLNLFQFLNGAIRILFTLIGTLLIVSFQFLNGAIRIERQANKALTKIHFNSLMVRLE